MTTEQPTRIQSTEHRPSNQYIVGETLVKLGVAGAALSVAAGLIEAIGPKPFEGKFAVADAACLAVAGLGKFLEHRGSRKQRQ